MAGAWQVWAHPRSRSLRTGGAPSIEEPLIRTKLLSRSWTSPLVHVTVYGFLFVRILRQTALRRLQSSMSEQRLVYLEIYSTTALERRCL